MHRIYTRWEFLTLIAVLAVGALLRGAYLAEIVEAPDFRSPVLDPQFNDYWARALVSGDFTPPPHADDPLIQSTPYGRPPGYPHVLAAIYACTGGSFLAPRLVQMFLGLAGAVLAWRLARTLYGSVGGLAGSRVVAVHRGVEPLLGTFARHPGDDREHPAEC